MPPDQPSGAPGTPGATGDDGWLALWVARAWRLWRLEIVACACLVGLAVALLAARWSTTGGMVCGLLTGLLVLLRMPGLRDVTPVLAAAERAAPTLQNALLAWHESAGQSSPRVRMRLAGQARHALDAAARPRALHGWLWLMLVGLLVASAIAYAWPASTSPGPVASQTNSGAADAAARTSLTWEATVTPPAYSGRPSTRLTAPTQVTALYGSTIALSLAHLPADAEVRVDGAALALTRGPADARTTFQATTSTVVVVQARGGRVLASIALVVQADAAPDVRITEPAADLRREVSRGRVRVRVTARDDLGLRDLRLRFTKVSGSGESFTFEDGEWPLVVARPSRTAWTGEFVVDLDRIALGPGDSLVYHAVAHDARPGPEGAAESERFLIEVARAGALAAGDFSLPAPEDKFALSQRMVIQLTERLLEKRPRMRAEEYREQAQALAVAQRSVKAEFVFMLGGEVEDEFEEAAHSHEVEAGRLDNRGQSDLTDAVRHMSQAERRLTDADLREALAFEYRALASLQAAFGKARYFMRTLPTPVQLDATRRLTGTREGLAAAAWAFAPLPEAARRRALAVLTRVEGETGELSGDALRAIVELDPAGGAWVARVQEVRLRDGRVGLARLLRSRLAASSPVWFAVPLARAADDAGAGPTR